MKMGEHGIATVSDAADKISCFDILSNSHRNRIRLQVTEGGIDRIRILDYYGISADFTYFLVRPTTTVFKSHQGIREKPGAFSFSAAIHHIYNPSITWGIHRQSIAISAKIMRHRITDTKGHGSDSRDVLFFSSSAAESHRRIWYPAHLCHDWGCGFPVYWAYSIRQLTENA